MDIGLAGVPDGIPAFTVGRIIEAVPDVHDRVTGLLRQPVGELVIRLGDEFVRGNQDSFILVHRYLLERRTPEDAVLKRLTGR
jgi:hypothetical protein